jgi:site-specific recombinase XerD
MRTTYECTAENSNLEETEAIARFEAHLRHERVVSAYRSSVSQGLAAVPAVCGGKGGERSFPRDHGDPFELCRDAPQDLEKSSQGTQAGRSALLYRYLNHQEIIASNPVAQVSLPKLKKLVPAFLNVDETFHSRRLASEMPASASSWRRFRNWALFDRLYSTGLRAGNWWPWTAVWMFLWDAASLWQGA